MSRDSWSLRLRLGMRPPGRTASGFFRNAARLSRVYFFSMVPSGTEVASTLAFASRRGWWQAMQPTWWNSRSPRATSWGCGAEGLGVPVEARKLTRAWTWAVSDWASSPGNRSGIVVPGLARCGLVKNSTIHSGRTRVPTASSTGAGFVFTPVAEMPPA